MKKKKKKKDIDLIRANIYNRVNLKIIVKFDEFFESPISETIKIDAKEKRVPANIIDFYNYFDGFKTSWFNDPAKGIG